MTFENFIPPRVKKVLEITGEVPADFETTKKKFTEIQPACNYKVSKSFSASDKNLDAILIQSTAIGNLQNAELVKLIKAAAKNLNPRGRLIFVLENMGYAENVMAILEGQPLKFKVTLSKVELEQAIQAAGLKEFSALNAVRRVGVNRGVAEAAKVDLSVFAYIISATPEKLPPRTVIQMAVGESLVCGHKRIFEPRSFITTEPNISFLLHNSRQDYKLFTPQEFDRRIYINQRISFKTFENGRNLFYKMKNAGYLFIEEIDDNPIIWKKDYEGSGNINFIGVHAVQTSTEYLADYFRQFNPNVKVFANQLKTISPLRDFKKENKFPVRILFAAVNRDAEFKEILPILNQFAQKYGDKIIYKVIAKTELFNALQTPNKILVGDPNYYNGQFVDYEKYLQTLRETDIALLPLVDNEFNRSKSDLKFIECGACGATALASSVVYPQTVKDGENGLIFHDLKEFAQKLEFLIENREKRFKLATAAYNYVKNNRLLCQHYEERLDWYFELFARLDELNKETQARIEKLAPLFEGKNNSNAEIIIPDER